MTEDKYDRQNSTQDEKIENIEFSGRIVEVPEMFPDIPLFKRIPRGTKVKQDYDIILN